MDFVTVSTGLILPYWMGLPIRYIHKTKFTRNKLNQAITKNNITILNDQEVQLNSITLVGRKDYTNPNRKKTL